MKKVLFVTAAIALAFSFASCKVETSKVTVSVVDLENNPINDREVYYTDMASIIIGTFAPDPNAPLMEDDGDSMSFGRTNAQGTVTFSFDLGVENLDYYFFVLDEGTNQYLSETVHLKRGNNAEVEFKVNR